MKISKLIMFIICIVTSGFTWADEAPAQTPNDLIKNLKPLSEPENEPIPQHVLESYYHQCMNSDTGDFEEYAYEYCTCISDELNKSFNHRQLLNYAKDLVDEKQESIDFTSHLSRKCRNQIGF